MREWMKKHHVVMRTLSLLLSVLLWFYVVYRDNPEKAVTFSDIPVRLLNEETLKNRYSLVVDDAEDLTVTVRLSGTFSRLERLSADDLRVTADLSRISQPGTYSLSYDIAAMDGVTVVERSPSQLSVSVDELVTVELPVNVSITGTMPEGLVADTAIVDPVTVRVSGRRALLESAAAAQVTVSAAELTGPYSAELPFTITDEAGKALATDAVTLLDETVHVEIPVYSERTVPLAVDVLYGNGADESNTVVTLSRDSVTIRGTTEAVEAVDRILIDTVDVSANPGEIHREYPISLPEGVSLLDGEKTVSVDITYTNLETRQVVVTDIRVVNNPVLYAVSADTSEVPVTVRGTPAQLDALVSGDIALEADLSKVNLISGMQTVPVRVILSEKASSLGVFGEYTIVISSERLTDTPIF